MTTKPGRLLLVLALLLLGATGYALWRNSSSSTRTGPRKTLCYQDSMHPWIKSDQPGKCTVCGMDLTPIYAGDKGFGVSDDMVVLGSNSITVLHVQTEEVKRRPLFRALRVAGTLEPNESRKAIVSAPSPGRIQTSAVEFPGVEVEKGQMLITLFSPELVQRRLFLRSVGGDTSSAGQGLLQAGQNSSPYLGDIVAPQSGLVVERNVYPGQYVVEGEKLLTIVDASVLWFRFDAYDRQLSWLELGQTIEVTTEAVPGRSFPAVISFIEPTFNDATRTVKVRAEIQNPIVTTNGHPQRLLRFGLYAEGRVLRKTPDVLAVPRSAILFPGGAAYAYVDEGGGAYERHRLKLGRQGDDLWEVLEGLDEDDRVVTSGNVLIDAQAQFNQGNTPADAGASDMASADPKKQREDAPAAVSQPLAATAHEMEAPGEMLTSSQHKALAEFLAVADGISQALAADSLDQLKRHTGALPGVVAALVKATGDDHPWHAVLKHIQEYSRWPAAADLAAARKSFLPFSTNVVALVQLVRGREEDFRSLKVYHCPMAPKPGLWFQAKGPLRNPYYGAEMLTCGTEVRASAGAAVAAGVKPPAHMDMASPTSERPDAAQLVGRASPRAASAVTNEPSAMAQHPETAALPQTTVRTNSSSPMEPEKHPGSYHSRAVRSAMSPGAEPQTMRRASILKGLEMDAAAAGLPTGQVGRVDGMQPRTGGATPEVQQAARRQQALASFVDVADRLGQALANEDVPRFYEPVTVLPSVFTLLRQEFGTNHPWNGMIQQVIETGLPLASLGQWRIKKNLTEARAMLLPFSAATVDLAKALKKEKGPFANLKIYHCSALPKPGLWMQTQGPLRNPFHSSTNLNCCQEVKL